MKRTFCGCLGLLVGVLGCATTSAAPTSAAPTPIASTPLVIPAPSSSGPEREVSVILDVPHLKVMTITLRQGTALPEHTAPVPVIIQAAAGAGTAILGDQRLPLDSSHAVSLAPNAPHAVEPEPGTDMMLLVFHLRGGQAP